jgi:hypothetical protein
MCAVRELFRKKKKIECEVIKKNPIGALIYTRLNGAVELIFAVGVSV